MDTRNLISKLEHSAKHSLQLAEQEREKNRHGAYFPLGQHHEREMTRENYFRGQHDIILTIVKEISSFDYKEEDLEEEEEVIFLARKLIAGVTYPWIRRKVLDESLYCEIYKDTSFEPYTHNLHTKKKLLLQSDITILGLEDSLEKELEEGLRHFVPQDERKKYCPVVQDILFHKDSLSNIFKDGWTQKSRLILFRLHEFGLL